MHMIEAKSILSNNNGMNIYRGCTHGCIYCDSRSECYQMKHDFEDVEVKINAPLLLEGKLKSKRQRCMIGFGSMCDPYLHYEEDLQLTRKCLEIIMKYKFGCSLITKSTLIMRDLELLQKINKQGKCIVQVTLTTFDDKLCRIIEPNVPTTSKRMEILQRCKELGIPTIVWFCPILPFINDTMENFQQILTLCANANVYGIMFFGAGLTLRDGNREYFYQQLDKYFPNLKEKYIKMYGNAYNILSPKHKELSAYFYNFCKEHYIESNPDKLFEYMHEFPDLKEYEQLQWQL